MKKIYSVFFSSRLMAAIFLVFLGSIAAATFIENDFGSPTARALIYNSWWFELMLLIGIVNLTGTIFIKQLYKKERLPIFIFHFAFLLILLGAAITHYFGYEGMMHIREGETSNKLVSNSVYFSAAVNDHGKEGYAEKQVYFSALSENKYVLKFPSSSNNITVECLKIIPNAAEKITEAPQGDPVVELVLASSQGRQTIAVSNKQSRKVGNLLFSLNDSTNQDGVNIFTSEEGLMVRSGVRATSMAMATQVQDSLTMNVYQPFLLRTLYNFDGVQVVAKNYFSSGKVEVEPMKDAKPDEFPDALYVKATVGGTSKTVAYFARHNALNDPLRFDVNGVSISASYGAKEFLLPFSLQLKKFIVEHYPGSMSPSWFESKIVLKDPAENLEEERRIFMNNVLQHKGYRFYQSSYDTDGLGTIFSVNFDFWGTFVTYFGYLMLAIGFILTFFNKNSRFRRLSTELSRLREVRKTASILLVLILSGSMGLFAQSTVPDSMKIDIRHAAEFGELLLQDPGGRIKPINTLSSELLRKVSRKTWLMGQSSDQVLLGMMVYPGFWQSVPMIRVSHPEIQKILGVKEPYVAFANIISHGSSNHTYLLGKYVEEAYQKKPAYRNQFDNEIIRVDERINLCYMVYTGELLRIFPTHKDLTRTWVSPVDTQAKFSGKDSILVSTIIPIYFRALRDAAITKNGSLPAEALGVIRDFQLKYGHDIMPSAFKLKLEVWYNRINIFDRLSAIYGLIGFVLLLCQFLSVFFVQLNLKPFIRVATGIIILAFVLHLAGLVSRWYISGHAPWSNAYESLIYIAFATVLAGLIFSRKAGIALSVTSLLAWLVLFVAHLNWMDPEITNLPPVLKSYWLLIHVAMITASYGFLALGALLAFINLVFMSIQSKANYSVTKNIMAEFSIIIEMTLIVGLFMLTIGMFLGGVWANESWGRYWGWDAKETWALVSVLVYAFITHMRIVPGLKGNYLFNLFALLGFSSIIMTYFGVNYYLSGLHSYAKGDPLPVPVFVYYTLAVIAFVAIIAFTNQQRMKRMASTNGDEKPMI